VQNGKLTYGYNYVADQRFKVQSDQLLPEGDHIFSFEFKPTGEADISKGKGVPANNTLFVDGAPIGRGDLPVTIPLSLGLAASVSVGADAGSPVMADYKVRGNEIERTNRDSRHTHRQTGVHSRLRQRLPNEGDS
jgi:hypothetical protein